MSELPETNVCPPDGRIEVRHSGENVTYQWIGGDTIAISRALWEEGFPELRFDVETRLLEVGPFKLTVLGYTPDRQNLVAVRAPED